MYEPTPQETLTDQARLFHHPRRSDVLHIAMGADAEDRGLLQCPVDDLGEDFRHEALPPPGSCEHVADVETVGSGVAQGESTPEVSASPVHDDIGSRDVRGRGNALGDVSLGVAAVAMRPPDHEASDGGVLSVGVKDGADVFARNRPQNETGGMEVVRQHGA
jgi:hypothetical protein